jgi:hypothetical protein
VDDPFHGNTEEAAKSDAEHDAWPVSQWNRNMDGSILILAYSARNNKM